MSKRYMQLRKELQDIGIPVENMSDGTVNGTPAIFIRKNGRETEYMGYSEGDVMEGRAAGTNEWLKQNFS